MDVPENACDGERQFFFQTKEGYKASCVKILMFAMLLGSRFYLKYCTPHLMWKLVGMC